VTEGFDMGSLFEKAQAMQEQLLAAQAQAAETVVEGQAGGGMVKVRITGGMEVQSVSIDPQVVDPDDVPMLEDLVLAAIHDAVAKGKEATQAATRDALGGLDLGSFGLPGPGA
jgi:DNA-binding YbaB/EbfC family protein